MIILPPTMLNYNLGKCTSTFFWEGENNTNLSIFFIFFFPSGKEI